MTDATERVAVACPSCAPDRETVHEVLKPGGQSTVRCTECGHVHKTAVPSAETVTRDVVVSQGGESFTASTEAPATETVAAGEEFVLETPEAVLTVRIMDLQLSDGRRVEEATVRDVDTFWTRDVGNVAVNVTLHPADGTHDDTESLEVRVPGDFEFIVGETYDLAGEEFDVSGIAIRDDAAGYDFDRLDHEGDAAAAKDVTRLYSHDRDSSAWSAW